MPDADLASWRDFYSLIGAAAATMVALLFVAASVGTGVFTAARPAGLRFFLSATVVNFATILLASLIMLAPLDFAFGHGALIAALGLFGLGYYTHAWVETRRDGILAKVDFEDRLWYGVLPVIGHLIEAGSDAALIARAPHGPEALAGALGLLIVVGVHNAWDITVWVVGKKTGE